MVSWATDNIGHRYIGDNIFEQGQALGHALHNLRPSRIWLWIDDHSMNVSEMVVLRPYPIC